jgi:hypothetical protein
MRLAKKRLSRRAWVALLQQMLFIWPLEDLLLLDPWYYQENIGFPAREKDSHKHLVKSECYR